MQLFTVYPELPIRSKRAAVSLMVAMHEDISPDHGELHQILAEDLTLWALLHPLPDGKPPTTLEAVHERLCDLHSLEREIMAVTPSEGAVYESAALNVRYNMRGALPIVAAISARAVEAYIIQPRLVLSDGNGLMGSGITQH